jgi:hypothetical protein
MAEKYRSYRRTAVFCSNTYLSHIAIYKAFVAFTRFDFNMPRAAALNWATHEFAFISYPKLNSGKESHRKQANSFAELAYSWRKMSSHFLTSGSRSQSSCNGQQTRGLASDILQLGEEVVATHNTSAAKHLLPGDFLETGL